MISEALMENLCKNLALQVLPTVLPFPAPITAILNMLFNLADQQQKSVEMLNKIITEPYKTGKDYLKDAELAPEKSDRNKYIDDARRSFAEAANLEEGLMKARSHFYAGVCYDLLGNSATATGRYEQAYQVASDQLKQLKPNKVKQVGRKLTQGTVTIGGVIVGAVLGGLDPLKDPNSMEFAAKLGNLGNNLGNNFTEREQQKISSKLEELFQFMLPLALVLTERQSTIIAGLGTVESQVKAIAKQLGRTAAQWNEQGLTHLQAAQYQLALNEFDFAIQLDPRLAAAYHGRGECYHHLHQYQKAIKNYDRALQLAPGNASTYLLRGWAYASLDLYQEAIEDFDCTLQLEPENAFIYRLRAKAYTKLKKYQEALADFDHALQLDPNYTEAHKIREALYQEMKKSDKT